MLDGFDLLELEGVDRNVIMGLDRELFQQLDLELFLLHSAKDLQEVVRVLLDIRGLVLHRLFDELVVQNQVVAFLRERRVRQEDLAVDLDQFHPEGPVVLAVHCDQADLLLVSEVGAYLRRVVASSESQLHVA